MKLFPAGFNGRYYLIDESVPSRAERDAPNNRGGEMQLYLAGVGQFYGEKLYDWMRGGNMNLYLAGVMPWRGGVNTTEQFKNINRSFSNRSITLTRTRNG